MVCPLTQGDHNKPTVNKSAELQNAHICNFIVRLTGDVLHVLKTMLIVSVVKYDWRFDCVHCTGDGLK